MFFAVPALWAVLFARRGGGFVLHLPVPGRKTNCRSILCSHDQQSFAGSKRYPYASCNDVVD